ncbi:MAG: S9 family peptidase [Erythrobacteraceae bacterium]|nr:S9 family peptidase [Erythrobacteraceae bacterium]
MKFLAKSLTGVLAGAFCLAAPLAAQDTGAEDRRAVAERFGVRSSVLDISLSPSGSKIAWIAPGPNHTEVLNVFDLNSDAGIQRIASNTEINGDLDQCEWATDTRLICTIDGMALNGDGNLIPYDRMFAINSDGSDPLGVDRPQNSRALAFNQNGGDIVALDVEGEEGQILITRNWIPESSVNTRLANNKDGLGIERFDVSNGRRKIEEQPDERASYYLADENGAVRFKSRSLVDSRGYLTGERVRMVRDAGESGWERLEGVTLDGEAIEDFSPTAVDAANNSLYAYYTINGYRAVIRIPLDGSGVAEVMASRDDVDVDRLLRIGRQRRVVGVSYATEKFAIDYFDEELAKLSSDLGAALPNQPLVSIAGASADERHLLIIASSDTDPGTVYLYNKDTRQLEVLLSMRDALVDRPMGQMQPITFPAADGTQIPGYLTLPPGSDGKNLPGVVLPHGGPAARDYWGFDWLVQFFISRGYAVLQPNYRGSSGYGEAWFGRNGYQAWDVAIGDVNDAGRWLVSEGIANADQLAIVGWSYGGYAALQSQVVAPDLYNAVVAIAPVTDLEFLREDARAYTNFRFRDEQLGSGPHIAAGSPKRHAESFAAPVALFHGTHDVNVRVKHSRAMADALKDAGKPVTYVEFDDLQHDLGDNKARIEMLEAIDLFLSESLGG